MNRAQKIVKELCAAQADQDVKPLIDEFKLLLADEKQSVEAELIRIFENEKMGEVPRSWMPTLLGAVGTKTACQYLMKRLPVEKNDLFRRWISAVLIRYYSGDERVELVSQQIEREKTASNRLYLLTILIESKSTLAYKSFVKYLNEEQGDYALDLRRTAAAGLAQIKVPEATEFIAQRLKIEKDELVLVALINALEAIGDRKVIDNLLAILQDSGRSRSILLAVLQALGQICQPQDKKALDAILNAVCYSDRVVAFSATDTLLKLASKAETAQLIIDSGLRQDAADRLVRIADALRVIGSNEAVDLLKDVRGDSLKEERARILLEQIGGSQALDVLVNRRLDVLKQTQKRVEDFDAQAVSIFESTVTEAKKGFLISLWMSGTIFVLGVALLIASIYLMFQPNLALIQQLFGAGGAIAGLGSILAMFYKGPVERIERSVANLVQTEIAFLGYIRQITQISAMFERKYLSNEEFKLEDLKSLLLNIERCLKETMPLVNQYTAQQIATKLENIENGKVSNSPSSS